VLLKGVHEERGESNRAFVLFNEFHGVAGWTTEDAVGLSLVILGSIPDHFGSVVGSAKAKHGEKRRR
jgi:hypothetical protein